VVLEWVDVFDLFFVIVCQIISISSLAESLGGEFEDGFSMRSCRVPC
jgi:hypothetical protein